MLNLTFHIECRLPGKWTNGLGSTVSFDVDKETGLMTGEYTTKVGDARECIQFVIRI